MKEHIYEKWLRERDQAVRDIVRDCYEECQRMLEKGNASEDDLRAWRKECIHALYPAPLKKYFWEFAVSTFTKHNLPCALDLLGRALEHVNHPGFALPNLKIDFGPAVDAPPPEVLLGME